MKILTRTVPWSCSCWETTLIYGLLISQKIAVWYDLYGFQTRTHNVHFFPSLSCFLLVLIMVIRILWYVWFVFWFDTKLNLNMNLYCVSILDMKLILNLDSLRFKSQFESWFDNHVCDNWGVQSIHVESWKLILVVFVFISVTNWNFWTLGSWVAASEFWSPVLKTNCMNIFCCSDSSKSRDDGFFLLFECYV
jgi:hypothetical protein